MKFIKIGSNSRAHYHRAGAGVGGAAFARILGAQPVADIRRGAFEMGMRIRLFISRFSTSMALLRATRFSAYSFQASMMQLTSPLTAL